MMKGRTMKAVYTLAASILASGILIACGSGSQGVSEETNGDRMTKYYRVNLPDGREIDCLATGSHRGGLSCDWNSAK